MDYIKKAEEYIAENISRSKEGELIVTKLVSLTGFCVYCGTNIDDLKAWGDKNIDAYKNIKANLAELVNQAGALGICSFPQAKYILDSEFDFDKEEIDESLVISEDDLIDY